MRMPALSLIQYPGRHEVNGPEPFDQEYPGGMKQSSGTYGDLMSAACMLVEPARGNERCFGVAACRTLKTLWPSHFDQNSTTGLLRSKSFLPGDISVLRAANTLGVS